MLYIFKDNVFTGTTYEEDKQEYRNHHGSQGEICLWLEIETPIGVGETLSNFNSLVCIDTNNIIKKEKLSELSAIDSATVRPLRSILSGTNSDSDKEYLDNLESRAVELRKELSSLSIDE